MELLFGVLLFAMFGNIFRFGLRMAWGFWQLAFTIILFPLILFGVLITGIVQFALPLVIIYFLYRIFFANNER